MTKSSTTKANHREVEVLGALRRLGGSARNVNLAELLDVSEETIRRTTKALAKNDLVRRVHGGVYLTNAEAGRGLVSRLGRQSSEKGKIARATADMIPNGACVFLGVGSTTAFVAQALRNHKRLTAVTNALNNAQTLANTRDNRVFLAGGELIDAEWGAFGPETRRFIREFRFDVAVLSVDGICGDIGFLLASSEEAALARAVIKRSHRTIVVVDHLKFGLNAPFIVCPPELVNVVVTDRPVSTENSKAFTAWNVDVVVADLEAVQ